MGNGFLSLELNRVGGGKWSSKRSGSKLVDQMLEALHIPPEHIAGAWRAGHSETLVLHHERLFKSMDDRGVHAKSDDAPPFSVHSI